MPRDSCTVTGYAHNISIRFQICKQIYEANSSLSAPNSLFKQRNSNHS